MSGNPFPTLDSENNLFFKCNFAMQAWRWHCNLAAVTAPVSSAAKFRNVYSAGYDSLSRRTMGTVFLMMIHAIWNMRNEVVHEIAKGSPSQFRKAFLHAGHGALANAHFVAQVSPLFNIIKCIDPQPM